MVSSERMFPGWTGCGRTVLVVVDDSLAQGEGSRAESLVREYTDHGGSDYLLEIVSGLGDDALGAAALGRLLGEDGGPGERSGLYELAGRGEAGTLVLPLVSSDAVALLEQFALRYPQVLLCCPISSGAAPARLERPTPNLVLLYSGQAGGSVAAALAGQLAARDFFPLRTPTSIQRPTSTLRGALPELDDCFSSGELRALASWRRWQGLYRSLDQGSRWTVFELASDIMARRLERELRAFLHSLVIDGFLPFRKGFELEVKLEKSDPDGGGLAESRLSIAVCANLDSAAGISMERVMSSAADHARREEAMT